ncbi:unnamed protein product [Vicia faba]|uniref:Uncharacterized protein n=1 Tax=Vicia faba TaxID=3906 RepID=A0AAV1ANN7_VICFA|nr:unnamed protein product [Vicia faba]
MGLEPNSIQGPSHGTPKEFPLGESPSTRHRRITGQLRSVNSGVVYPGRSGNYHFVSTGPVLSGPSISQFMPLVSGKGSPALIMLGRPLLMYLSLMEARGNGFHRQAFLAVKAAPPESRMDPFARSAGSPPYRVASVRREERCWRRGTRICPFYTSTKCPPPGSDHVHNQRLPSMVSGASLPNYQTWQQRLHAVLVVLLSSLLGTDKPHRDVLEHSLYVIFKRTVGEERLTTTRACANQQEGGRSKDISWPEPDIALYHPTTRRLGLEAWFSIPFRSLSQ